MFNKEQIENKIDYLDKRTHKVQLIPIPTSIITAQKLARLKFQHKKRFNFFWRPKEIYQFK